MVRQAPNPIGKEPLQNRLSVTGSGLQAVLVQVMYQLACRTSIESRGTESRAAKTFCEEQILERPLTVSGLCGLPHCGLLRVALPVEDVGVLSCGWRVSGSARDSLALLAWMGSAVLEPVGALFLDHLTPCTWLHPVLLKAAPHFVGRFRPWSPIRDHRWANTSNDALYHVCHTGTRGFRIPCATSLQHSRDLCPVVAWSAPGCTGSQSITC
jgi:hypothetical protein